MFAMAPAWPTIFIASYCASMSAQASPSVHRARGFKQAHVVRN